MKIELSPAQLNTLSAALRGHQAAIEGILQELQQQIQALQNTIPAVPAPQDKNES